MVGVEGLLCGEVVGDSLFDLFYAGGVVEVVGGCCPVGAVGGFFGADCDCCVC